ncbi:MAG TPA: response regulator [Bryobacteraceae bacterium]|nr:response regulator [Bryobacteraceae bacterium]
MPKILVVEDNESSRDMLARRLSRRGYQVIAAGDGKRGIAMAHEQSPDLIVMDMSLPELDGWEATHRLKADPATRAIPIIALTAHAMASDRKKALDAGCDDYYTKPVDFESLVRSLEAFLAARKSPARTSPIVPAASLGNSPAPLWGDPQC